MTQKIPFTDPILSRLLIALLHEDQLPALDRWFPQKARAGRWSADTSARLWQQLGACLRSAQFAAFQLQNSRPFPGEELWPFLQRVLKDQIPFWIRTALQPPEKGVREEDFLRAGFPFWLRREWLKRVEISRWTGEHQESFLFHQHLPPPLYVRFLPGARGETAQRELGAVGRLSELFAGIYQFEGRKSLYQTQGWKNGGVEIQDASSQAVLLNFDLRPGLRIWDVCAGQGGKTLAMAGFLLDKGVIWATDIYADKLDTLKQRAKKAQWSNIRTKVWSGSEVPDFGIEIHRRKGFDRVLVDAPCSASGTWRRDPEGRYRLKPATLKDLNRHQARLVRLGWEALRPGGRLLYVTCSWITSENEDVVDNFVKETGAGLIRQDLVGLPDLDSNTLFFALLEKK